MSRSLLFRSLTPQRLVRLFIGATYVFVAALFLAVRVDRWG
ncbi:hypothetical protein [Natrinema sp. DC36]|nr:hypothetical protein [Natrinema sp. DC36]